MITVHSLYTRTTLHQTLQRGQWFDLLHWSCAGTFPLTQAEVNLIWFCNLGNGDRQLVNYMLFMSGIIPVSRHFLISMWLILERCNKSWTQEKCTEMKMRSSEYFSFILSSAICKTSRISKGIDVSDIEVNETYNIIADLVATQKSGKQTW